MKTAGREELVMDFSNVIIAVVVVALFLLVFFATRYTNNQKGFDEMQLKKRGDAFRIGFFTLLGCVIAILFLNSFESVAQKVEINFLLCASIMITVGVFGVYSVFAGAFFRMNENPKTYLGICFAVMFPNAMIVIGELKKSGTLLKEGKATFTPCGNLVNVLTFLAISVAVIIKMIIDKKEEKE